jgi:hypothetical protein
MAAVRLTVAHIAEDAVTFEYPDPKGVMEHLLKSGAGTAFYDAVDPAKRAELERRFLARLAERNGPGPCRVVHDCVTCIARRP